MFKNKMKDHNIIMKHGDLDVINVFVKDDKMTNIIDWDFLQDGENIPNVKYYK